MQIFDKLMKATLCAGAVTLAAAFPLQAQGLEASPSPIASAASDSLAARLERAEAINAAQNLMGKYSYYHTASKHKECLDLFAMKTPDVRVEMVWGVYKGAESIKRLYPGFHAWADDDGIGRMFLHTMTTQVIEVAKDGKTAKGVWVSPGVETMPKDRKMTTDTKIDTRWSWIKYAADFIKEDGEWKIWHLHVYGLFSAPPGKDWQDVPFDYDKIVKYGQTLPVEFRPDAPPTTRLWKYQRTVRPELVPAPPLPYTTFDPATAY
jgi:hypothetical protein